MEFGAAHAATSALKTNATQNAGKIRNARANANCKWLGCRSQLWLTRYPLMGGRRQLSCPVGVNYPGR